MLQCKDASGIVYKAIPGYPWCLISEHGVLMVDGRFIDPKVREDGYVCLYHGEDGLTNRRHRLVAMAWLDLPENYLELDVNHLNNTPGSDHYTNLEWATKSRNINHAVDQNRCGNETIYAKRGLDGEN